MKSIRRRFDDVKEKNPYYSDYICFAFAIEGQKFTRKRLINWFNKLVDKDDYVRNERPQIIDHLCEINGSDRTKP